MYLSGEKITEIINKNPGKFAINVSDKQTP